MSRRGMTLVEALLATSILVSLLVIGLSVWQAGLARGQRIDFQMDAAASMAQLLLLLEDDLVHLLPGTLEAARVKPAPSRVVTLVRVASNGPAGQANLFLEDNLALRSEKVTWRFDPAIRRVLRNGAPLPAGPFEDVLFTYEPASVDRGDLLSVTLEVTRPDAPPSGRGSPRIRRTFTRHCAIATTNHLAEDWAGP